MRTDLVVAAITSQIPDVVGEDEISLSGTDLRTAGLPKASMIKVGKIFTIHQGLIRKKLGHVSDSTLENILQKLLRSMH